MTGVQTCALPICKIVNGIVDYLMNNTAHKGGHGDHGPDAEGDGKQEIGRASCRERV